MLVGISGLILLLGLVQTSVQAAEKTLTIGMINPQTGALGPLGQGFENAVTLAFEQINSAGGVLGYELALEMRDSQTDPAASEAAAQELVDLGVTAIIGAAGSTDSLAVSKVTIPNKVVQISGASSSPELSALEDYGYVFRTVPSDSFQGEVLAREVSKAGFSTIGILRLDNAYGQGLADAFRASFKGTMVIERVFPESLIGEQGGFKAHLDALIGTGPEAIVLISYVEHTIGFLSAWDPEAFKGTWFLTDGSKSPELIERVGAQRLEGIKGSAPAMVGGSGFDPFRKAYATRFKEEPGVFTDSYYDAAMILGLAIVSSGSTESQAIRDAIPEVSRAPGKEFRGTEFSKAVKALAAGKDIDYSGASGRVDLDSKGDVTGFVEIWQIQDGEIVQREIVSSLND
jgi:ABC-type branched-subunit amino acid transport system substrate-binding protein